MKFFVGRIDHFENLFMQSTLLSEEIKLGECSNQKLQLTKSARSLMPYKVFSKLGEAELRDYYKLCSLWNSTCS